MTPRANPADLAALLRRRKAILESLAVVDRKIAQTQKRVAGLKRQIALLIPVGRKFTV